MEAGDLLAPEQPTITISFADQAAYDEMVEAVALADGYQAEVPADPSMPPGDPSMPPGGEMIPNPQSKDEFMLMRIGGFLASKKQAVSDAGYAAQAPTQDPGFAGGSTPAGAMSALVR